MVKVLALSVFLITGSILAQNILVEDCTPSVNHRLPGNTLHNSSIELPQARRSGLRVSDWDRVQISTSYISELYGTDATTTCFMFVGVISTAVKTPHHYTISAYEPNGGALIESCTDFFVFPTPCSYQSPIFCLPNVDALAIAYDASGHCIGKDFVEDLWVEDAIIEVDFYCD